MITSFDLNKIPDYILNNCFKSDNKRERLLSIAFPFLMLHKEAAPYALAATGFHHCYTLWNQKIDHKPWAIAQVVASTTLGYFCPTGQLILSATALLSKEIPLLCNGKFGGLLSIASMASQLAISYNATPSLVAFSLVLQASQELLSAWEHAKESLKEEGTGSKGWDICEACASTLLASIRLYEVRKMASAGLIFRSKGLEQYNEMVEPRIVDKEDDFDLIQKNQEFAKKLNDHLQPITEAQITQFVKALPTLDFKNAAPNSILLDPQLPYVAIAALKRGHLHPEHGGLQVATVLNFWGALKYHTSPVDLKTMELFDAQGAANQEAIQLLKQTFISASPSFSFLDGKKFDDFMKKMKHLPSSERRFLVVPNLQKLGDLSHTTRTISQAIIDHTHLYVFNRIHQTGPSRLRMPTETRIVPSTGMMQAFLDAEFREKAVKIVPRIYLSTQKQIRECGLKGTRDLMVPFPDGLGGSRCPRLADGFSSPWYDFPYHDFYHAIVASSIGSFFRKKGIELADFIESCSRESSKHKKLAATLTDLEFKDFRPDCQSRSYSEWEAFKKSISVIYSSGLSKNELKTIQAHLRRMKKVAPASQK